MSDLFNPENIFQIDPNKDYSAELVGEGKKFKDNAALARGKVESDAHIGRLENELKEVRDELQKRLTLEEVLTKISQNKQENLTPVTTPQVVPPAQTLNTDDITKLITDAISQNQAQTTGKQNVATVVETLKSSWGAGYQATLEAKRQELGLGREFMDQLAAQQPKAFLSLVGVAQKPTPASSPFDISGINTAGLVKSGHTGEKTQSFYDKLKRENPKQYFDKATQKEMYDQAMKLGEAYFDRT